MYPGGPELMDPLLGSTAAFWDVVSPELRSWAAGDSRFPLPLFSHSLGRYQPGLGVELEDEEDGQLLVIVTAYGLASLFPAVRRLVQDAPRVHGLAFQALRPAHPDALTAVVENESLDMSEVMCRCQPRHRRVDLDVVLPVGDRVSRENLAFPGFALLDRMLGEERVASTLGQVRFRVAMPSGAEGDWIPLPDLPARLASLPSSRRS